MTYLHVSLAINVLLFALFCCSVYFLHRSGKTIKDYEEFYEGSLVDLGQHSLKIQNLIQNNVIYSEDEEVKQLYKAVKSSYQILIGYANAGNGRTNNRTIPAAREGKQELLR